MLEGLLTYTSLLIVANHLSNVLDDELPGHQILCSKQSEALGASTPL